MQASKPQAPSLLATVLTAVVVALVVTLAVGVLVKPLVDARWQRIQRHLTTRDELISAAIGLAGHAKFLAVELPAGFKGPAHDRFMTERRRTFERMQTTIAGVWDAIGANAAAYPGPARTLITTYIGYMQGVMLSERTYLTKAQLVGDLSERIVWVIAPPPLWQVWHVPQRIRAVAELLAAIVADVPEPSRQPKPSLSPASS